MDVNIQLPSDPGQRRRLQNRIAQRKFRQKKNQQRVSGDDSSPELAGATTGSALGSTPRTPSESTLAVPFQPCGFPLPPDDESSSISRLAMWHGGDAGFGELTPGFDGMDSVDISAMTDFLLQYQSSLSTPSEKASVPNTSYASPARLSGHCQPQALPNSVMSPTPRLKTSQTTATSDPPLRRNSELGFQLSSMSPEGVLEGIDAKWQGAMHIAAQTGNLRILQILIRSNVDCNEKDSEGRTPLIHAVVQDHVEVALILLGHGVRLGEADFLIRTALHYAVLHQRERMLRLLLRHYVDGSRDLDIDAKDKSGWTALHMAVYNGFEEGVTMLLQSGANLHTKARYCPYAAKVIPHP
ncbi:ankyrin repeat-containing domain protein [Xylaria sp. CBS 124048]|nr:ankyrin repeat-containing domain protein [Xylaria sp. CBS 124048]